MTGSDFDPGDEPCPAPASKAWSPGRSMAASLAFGALLIGAIRGSADVDREFGAACRATFGSRQGPMTCLAWSPDGRTLAVSQWGPGVTLLDLATGRRRAIRPEKAGADEPRFGLGWSPDGRTLALSGYDGAIDLVEVEVEVEPGPGPAGPPRVVICPETSLRLFGGQDRRAATLLPRANLPTVLAFRRDGRVIASGAADGLVRIWDAGEDRERLSFPTAQGIRGVGGVNSVAFSPDGRTLATAGVGGVRLWDPATGDRKGAIIGGDSIGFGVVAFSPDGRSLAAASWDATIRAWDLATGREVARVAGHEGRTLALAWSPDGRTLASGGYDGDVRLWDMPENHP